MYELGQGSDASDADRDAIIRTLRDAGAAVERGDAEGVAAMFVDRQDTLVFDFLAAGVSHVDDIRENTARMAQATNGPVVCRYPKVEVRMLAPDLAYSMAYSEIRYEADDGGMDVHTRVTNIWRRIGTEWRAIHEHSSLPVDVASGRAEFKQPI